LKKPTEQSATVLSKLIAPAKYGQQRREARGGAHFAQPTVGTDATAVSGLACWMKWAYTGRVTTVLAVVPGAALRVDYPLYLADEDGKRKGTKDKIVAVNVKVD